MRVRKADTDTGARIARAAAPLFLLALLGLAASLNLLPHHWMGGGTPVAIAASH